MDNGTILNAEAITEAAIGAARPDWAIAGGPFDLTFHDPVTGIEISLASGDNDLAGEALEVRVKVTNVGLSPATAGVQVELLQSTVVLSPPSFGPPESLGILTPPALAPGSSHVLSFPAAFLAGFHMVTGQVEFDVNDA